jgi:prephenate dehydratase
MGRPYDRSLPVAVPGARGAYSQRAALRYFGSSCTALHCETATGAVRAVVDGRASHAVIAVENSITGVYAGVADAFFEGDVVVVGEILLPIRHAVMGIPGARLEDLSVISSHQSSLSQCRDWITSWGLAQLPVEDTAASAQALAESENGGLGILGSRELAATNGLELLAEGLSDHADNRTRFLVLGREAQAADEGWRNALQIGPVTTPRTLKTLRIQLESLGASRVRVPFLGSQDGKRFLVEFDHRERGGLGAATEACCGFPHRFLGTWVPDSRQAG